MKLRTKTRIVSVTEKTKRMKIFISIVCVKLTNFVNFPTTKKVKQRILNKCLK